MIACFLPVAMATAANSSLDELSPVWTTREETFVPVVEKVKVNSTVLPSAKPGYEIGNDWPFCLSLALR